MSNANSWRCPHCQGAKFLDDKRLSQIGRAVATVLSFSVIASVYAYRSAFQGAAELLFTLFIGLFFALLPGVFIREDCRTCKECGMRFVR